MKEACFLDEDTLHPQLQAELPIAVDTTKEVAMKYYPYLSEQFDSITDLSLYLQGYLADPLSGINCLLNTVAVADKINTRQIVQTSVSNYLKAYIENELINFRLNTKLREDEIIIMGYKVKVRIMLKPKSLQLTFKGKKINIDYFAAQIGGTYRPITEEERMYGISFIDGGIS